MEALLESIGIHGTDIFAGFAGGMLAALFTSGPRPNLWSLFSSIIGGTIAGAYFGPLAPFWLPSSWGMKASPGLSCGVGVVAMPLCKGMIAAVGRIKFGGGSVANSGDTGV